MGQQTGSGLDGVAHVLAAAEAAGQCPPVPGPQLRALDGFLGRDAGPLAAPTSALRTHVRTVSAAPIPSLAATAFIAAHSVG